MSVTVATASVGTKLEVLTASPSTWSPIPGIEGLTGPGNQQQMEEITNLGSDAGAEEVIPVSKKIKPLAFTAIYNSADPAMAFLVVSNAAWPAVKETFRFTSSAAVPKVKTFFAYVSGFDETNAAKKSARVAIELTPTGVLTLA